MHCNTRRPLDTARRGVPSPSRADAYRAGADPRPRTLCGAVIGRFLRCGRGSVALESALAFAILTVAFAALTPIFGTVFAEDGMSRGARAMARAIALDPGADPWAALVREGGLSAGATCAAWTATDTTGTCGGWTLTVHRGVSPATLGAARAGGTTAAGEMVLVLLERAQRTGFGVARREPSG